MNHIWKDTIHAISMKSRARVFTLRRKLSNNLRTKYEWWNIYITPLRGGRYAGTNYIKKYCKDEKPPQKICSVLVNLANEKSIDKELVIGSMESAIQKATLTKFGNDNNIEVSIDRENGEIKILKVLQVVAKVEDPNTEITIEDAHKKNSKNKRHINAFLSRLRWQAHFIQKFEMECQMEFRSVNKGYQNLVKPINKKFISAWEKGKTGYPLVDASMRCVVETGYLNFRMRALLVSFLTHHLWQPWQSGVIHLARNFLDFEPGIHYSQFQMQAGETGINMIRIYNPTKNAKEHDKEGVFIKKWIPELKKIPTPLLFEPWKMSLIDQETYECKIGKDYPNPIVEISETYKYAASKLWSIKSDPKVKEESSRILQKHTNANRKAFDD